MGNRRSAKHQHRHFYAIQYNAKIFIYHIVVCKHTFPAAIRNITSSEQTAEADHNRHHPPVPTFRVIRLTQDNITMLTDIKHSQHLSFA